MHILLVLALASLVQSFIGWLLWGSARNSNKVSFISILFVEYVLALAFFLAILFFGPWGLLFFSKPEMALSPMIILSLAGLLVITLKGVALWFAARGSQKGWFIIFLFVNLYILEIIYLIWFRPKTSDTVSGASQKWEK